MRYYKLIDQNEIIGVVTSDDFIKYSPITDCYFAATDETGEYINYKNQLYRSSWMQPIQQRSDYKEVLAITITKEEYDIFHEALVTQEAIDNVQTEKEREQEIIEQAIMPTPVDPIEQLSIDFIRSSKIKEMSYQCNKTIENGFNVETEDGTYHYSYTLEDQLNLMNLSAAIARGEEQLSYHADGELCRFYTAAEINEIISAGNAWKTYHTTYFNALKSYINSLETIEEISTITYGMELPEEFKTDVLRVIE